MLYSCILCIPTPLTFSLVSNNLATTTTTRIPLPIGKCLIRCCSPIACSLSQWRSLLVLLCALNCDASICCCSYSHTCFVYICMYVYSCSTYTHMYFYSFHLLLSHIPHIYIYLKMCWLFVFVSMLASSSSGLCIVQNAHDNVCHASVA